MERGTLHGARHPALHGARHTAWSAAHCMERGSMECGMLTCAHQPPQTDVRPHLPPNVRMSMGLACHMSGPSHARHLDLASYRSRLLYARFLDPASYRSRPLHARYLDPASCRSRPLHARHLDAAGPIPAPPAHAASRSVTWPSENIGSPWPQAPQPSPPPPPPHPAAAARGQACSVPPYAMCVLAPQRYSSGFNATADCGGLVLALLSAGVPWPTDADFCGPNAAGAALGVPNPPLPDRMYSLCTVLGGLPRYTRVMYTLWTVAVPVPASAFEAVLNAGYDAVPFGQRQGAARATYVQFSCRVSPMPLSAVAGEWQLHYYRPGPVLSPPPPIGACAMCLRPMHLNHVAPGWLRPIH
eukprot:366563-Chlamydomonas_euryale.AAC.2